jgi:hypothetical protein
MVFVVVFGKSMGVGSCCKCEIVAIDGVCGCAYGR